MITVAILINGQPIITRSAVNISEERDTKRFTQIYEVDDGRIINHNYDDGAIPLAIKMLEGVNEVGSESTKSVKEKAK